MQKSVLIESARIVEPVPTGIPQRRRGERDHVPPSPGPGVRRSIRQQTRRAQDWITTYRRNLIITDVVIVVSVVFASQATRLQMTQTVAGSSFGYGVVSLGLAAAWLAALGVNGVWDKNVLGAGPGEYHRITRASCYLFGLIAAVAYFTQVSIARGYLAMALPLGLAGLLAGRWTWRKLLNEHRRSGTHLNTVLVVGSRRSAVELATRLDSSPSSGYRVAGLCLPPSPRETVASDTAGFDVIGCVDDVLDAVERSLANTVAVSASESFGPEQVRKLAWELEGTGVRLVLAPSLTDVAGPRIHIRPVAGLPLMLVSEPHFKGPKLITKTAMDLVLSAVALILLSPVLLAVAAAVRFGDHGPVFFRHERVGFGGRTFRVWKFRTMRPGSDRDIAAVRAAAGQAGSTFYKSAEDPRISRIGRFLRKTSIDELPQLFNVICGQMSLVGPRPLVPGEGAEIGSFVERRMLVRPGITGLWQVSGRSATTAEERIRLDFYYVENWSVVGDLAILAKTVGTVLRRTGAY